jgi:hypothetical protein
MKREFRTTLSEMIIRLMEVSEGARHSNADHHVGWYG